MRTLILVLSLAVMGLAAPILIRPSGDPAPPVTLDARRLVSDARTGEVATYRDAVGNTVTYRVEAVVPATATRQPVVKIHVTHHDRQGAPLPGASVRYEHRPARHGLFPLMAPTDPRGFDRLWIWRRIRRATLTWRGKPREAWRFDLIDPALRPEGDGDHVVAWMDETAPVFGMIRFQRRGRTWDLVGWGED